MTRVLRFICVVAGFACFMMAPGHQEPNFTYFVGTVALIMGIKS